MSESVSNEMVIALRELYFERLAQLNRELLEAQSDITQEIKVQNVYSVLGLLAEVESRIDAMQTILIVLRECLGG